MSTLQQLFDRAFPVKCVTENCDGKCSNSVNAYCSNYNPYSSTDLNLYWFHERNPSRNPYLLEDNDVITLKCPYNISCECHVYTIRWIVFKKNNGCPYCRETKICEHNSAWNVVPNIQEFWDFERNKHVNPRQIGPFSWKKVWFRCPVEECHSWQKTMKEFSEDSRCVFCIGRKRCLHNPHPTYPYIPKKSYISKAPFAISAWYQLPQFMATWDFELNVGIDPETVRITDKKKYWFCFDGKKVKLTPYQFRR